MDLRAAVTALQERVERLEQEQVDQNVLARFQDNGAWAVHYSTVRMTVSTFTIATCLGIMAFKWSAPEPVLFWSAVGFWSAGITIFYSFSYLTMKMMRKQAVKRLEMKSQNRTAKPVPSVSKMWLWDFASWVIGILTVAYLFVSFCFWKNSPPPARERHIVSLV